MWSLGEALQKFIESLELTDRQQQEVSRQHTVVREALRKRLAPKTDFLSGSYSRNSTLTENPDAVLKRVRQALKEQMA